MKTKLQERREFVGLLPGALARLAGVSERTVRDMEETARKKVRRRVVQERVRGGVSKALDVKPSELFDSSGRVLFA